VFRVEGPDGWTVRVVPNLFPAFDRQEVVIHSPRHVRSFADLSDDEVAAVALAWKARGNAVDAYLHACINEGRAAGSSLPHSHSQLVWLDGPPPEVVRETEALLLDDELVVGIRGTTRAAVNRAGRLPYETLVAGDPFDLADALMLVRDVVRLLRTVEGAVPWNAWLHGDHLELVPRLTVLAGVELGAGIYVNTVAPEDAADALRRAAYGS
jgi:UDPglucose--hexose-1-phosphate uridylyltransferase